MHSNITYLLMSEKTNIDISRRGVLRKTAIGAVGAAGLSGISGTAIGQSRRWSNDKNVECDSLDEWINNRKPWSEQSGDERKQTVEVIKKCKRPDGPEAVHDALDTYDIPFGGVIKSYDVSLGDTETTDGVSTQDIQNPDTGGIEIDFSGFKVSDDLYNVSMGVYYNLDAYGVSGGLGCGQRWESGGEKPIDGAAILWYSDTKSEQYYNRDGPGNDGFFGSGHCAFEEWHRDKGATYRFDDREASVDWLDKPWWKMCKTKEGRTWAGDVYADMRPVGNYSPSEREVYGQYTHTYNKTTFSGGFSVGLPPSLNVTVQPESEQTSERLYDDEDGYELKLTQSDMD